MATTFDVAKLHDVRALAHKVYAQCREFPSYKLLTTPVRNIRNVLEEAEDDFDETRTLGPDELKFLEKIDQSGSILRQLDLALQSYRGSNYINVKDDAIADFKTILDVAHHELKSASKAISTEQTVLAIDTNDLPYSPAAPKSSMAPSSSSNATDSVHDRKSSYASSAWSMIPKEGGSQESTSDAMSVRSDSRFDEKELYDFGGIYPRSSPGTGSAVESRPFLDWRSPFASPDPLSIDIEQASAMLLADDDDDVLASSTMRSRSGTGSTVFVDQTSVPETKPIGLGVTRGEGEGQSIDNITVTLQAPTPQKVDLSTQSGESKDTQINASENFSATETSESDGVSRTTVLCPTVTPAGSPTKKNSPVHLSPKSAATELARRRRNSSISSVLATSPIKEDTIELEENQVKSGTTASQHTIQPPSMEKLIPDTSSKVEDGRSQLEEGQQQNSRIPQKLHVDIPAKTIPPWPAFDTGLRSPKDSRTDTSDTPSMPKRQPPPPPPKPRNHRRKRASSYRIVNASPVEDLSSEDELYTTSKPSSPAVQTQMAPVFSTHTIIPKVSIDASACNEDSAVGQEKVFTIRVSRSSSVGAESSTGEQSGMDVFANALRSKFSLQGPLTSVRDQDENEGFESQPLGPASDSSIPRRHSIAVAPSPTSPEGPAPALPPRPPPPPVPKRPSKQRYRRKSSLDQSARPSPPTIQAGPPKEGPDFEKELTPEPGLEVQNKLRVAAQPHQLRQRISVDAALNVANPSLDSQTAADLRDAARHMRSASASQVATISSNVDPSLTGFYGPSTDDASNHELERERINHIIHFFNSCQWDQAEAYLTDYLTVLIEENALARVRRVNHLLGVCASFKGEWLRAIPLFLNVIRTPVRHVGDLDDGDCAAAYWLGDTYSLLNKRTEALLAYCIAERSTLFTSPIDAALGDLMTAEQDAVQLGLPKTDFGIRWAQSSSLMAGDSILDPTVISVDTARMLLENGPRRTLRMSSEPFQLSQTQARSNALFKLTKNPWAGRYHRMKITIGNFEPDTAWPMAYDPLFNMANVHRGRLLAFECDLLAVFATNAEAKIPKAGALGLGRMDCFTCTDLTWLIQTLRECLKMLEMEFSEVANVEGTWFVARYTFMQDKIATTYYFSIALFKQTLRSGYGVDICPDGICSARIGRTNVDYEKGVHVSESKRIKRLVREYLDEASKQRPKSSRKGSSPSTTTPTGAAPFDSGRPPPIPARPSDRLTT